MTEFQELYLERLLDREPCPCNHTGPVAACTQGVCKTTKAWAWLKGKLPTTQGLLFW